MGYPIFAPGDVLTADDMNAVGLWLIKTQTVGTAVSSVTVTNAFSSNYDAYRIIWTDGTLSVQTDVGLQLSGSTASYFNWMVTGTYTSSAVVGANNNNGSIWNWAGGGNSDAAVLDVHLFNPFLAKHTYFNNGGFYSPNAEAGFSSGVHKVATSYTGFVIDPAGAATMTGGTIRVYGYRK